MTSSQPWSTRPLLGRTLVDSCKTEGRACVKTRREEEVLALILSFAQADDRHYVVI